MSRRSRRGVIRTEEVLENLRVGRNGATDVIRQAKIGSSEYRLAESALKAIDNLACQLTGDETYFHMKPGNTDRQV